VVRAHSLAELVRLGTMTGQCAGFLEASVVAGLNIVTAGATQAGNITLITLRERHRLTEVAASTASIRMT
jgi:Flp pilus assembly CpaF family ATPase